MKTYQITLTCTDPSEVEVREVATHETELERKAKLAMAMLAEVFKSQSSEKGRG